MNIDVFKSYKDINQELDDKVLSEILGMLDNYDKKHKNILKKPNNNILKNKKLQSKKGNITNKVNLILNKLSDSNINALVIEFIDNIGMVDVNEWNEIQKTFYLKMYTEINFIKMYIDFFVIISTIYCKTQQYNISFLISLVESKFKMDYANINSSISFIKEMDNNIRTNNMVILKNMVDSMILSDTIYNYCDDIILNQVNHLSDIHFWFNLREKKLDESEINIINKHLNQNVEKRNNILLSNLITKNKIWNVTNNKPVKLELKDNEIHSKPSEIENTISKYLQSKNIKDVSEYIENKCNDANNKNKFCESLLTIFFTTSEDSLNGIITLIKQLIKNHILYKSNLSRGLLSIYNNWNKKSQQFIKPSDRIKNILLVLKGIGITKGLEFLHEKYNI